MAGRRFTVETRGQAVVIFGGPSNLTSALINEFLSQEIFAAKISNPKELEDLKSNHDPDYLLVFKDGLTEELITPLQTLIQSGESRLITVQNLAPTEVKIPLSPIYKKIIYSDYVGETELSSTLIETWINDIQSTHTITVPGDGLGEFSLLDITDLIHLLVKAILYPSTEQGREVLIGNPEPISLLNLAYLIRTNIPTKVGLTFDSESGVEIPIFNSKVYENTLEKLETPLTGLPEELLVKYLKSHFKKEPFITTQHAQVETEQPLLEIEPLKEAKQVIEIKKEIVNKAQVNIPNTSIKKLTPLKNFQPVFIPLQSRKSKFPFPLKHTTRVIRSGPPRLHSIVWKGIIIAIALYLGTITFSVTIASLSINRIFNSLKNDELPQTSKLNKFITTYLQANWIAITSIPGITQQSMVVDANLLIDAYNQSLSVFETAQSLSKSAEDLTHYIFGSGNADVAQVVSLSRLQAEELYQKLSLLDGSLPAEPPVILSLKYHPAYKELKTKLGKLKRSVTTTKALLATTPDIIGLGGRRKYAVLFQNNMELRATGGFIGSFALLSFENGKLYDMPIFDVYDADGQLKGHVEPPKPIRDVLGEANWYLRDSNFDPDFPTSARRAEWFIKKSLNQDLDGTIAVNVNTLVSLLKATGPLEVSDYNETITDSNLYERAQFHAEVNFFPGSTQKKEFLSTVANSLFTRLPALGVGEGLRIVSALADTVQEKNTLVSMISPTTDHVFQTLGWNGQLSDFPCPSSGNCHKDYAMVVDSNFGVNKANYYLKRNIEEVITFDKDLAVNHVLRLNYQNTSTSTAWPAGIYKNYQRIYLPIGTTIKGVKIDNRQIESKDLTVSSEHGKFILAYLVSVPINSKVIVEVEYTTPQLPQENELLYTWYWQKQPGTSTEDSIAVYLNYPLYLNPTVISPQSELAPQQLKFNMTNDTDHRITVKFSK